MTTDLQQIVAELTKLEAEATPAPWSGKQDIRHTGMTSCYPHIVITSPSKPNRSYPSQPGIIASLDGTMRFEESKAIRDEDLAVMIAARNALPTLLSAAQRLIAIGKLCEEAIEYEAGKMVSVADVRKILEERP